MSALSPSLRPWSPWLAPLVPELVVGIGPLVERLANALGPMPARPEPGAHEPNGLSGLDRRGPYERLLLSEWALADELPDEFLRRAASAEHLFLQVERESPRGGRRCAVLFDTGPDQVGSPRLAHLALLAVFARRAEEARATLAWGALQLPGPEATEVSGASYLRLLALRCARRPTPDDHRAWAERLALAERDELWVVGGPVALRGAPPRAAHLEVRDVLEAAGPDELEVQVRRPGRPARPVRLPLPPPELRTRLIRNPLRAADAPPPTVYRASSQGTWGELLPQMRFSGDGYRLLCRDVDGTVIAFRTPGRPDDQRKPRRVHVQGELLAVGWAHRNLLVLRRVDGGFFLDGGRFRERWLGPELPVPPAPTDLVATSVPLVRNEANELTGGDVVWFADADRNLWRWAMREHATRTSGGLAVGRRDGRELLVLAEQDHTRVVRGGAGSPAVEARVPLRGVAAHVGSGGGWGVGTVLVEGADAWAFAPREPDERPVLHRPVAGARIVGAWGDWRARGVVYLLGERLFSRQLEPTLAEVELPTHGPVVAAACSPMHYSRLVAWMERSGAIVFHHLDSGPVRMLAPGGRR